MRCMSRLPSRPGSTSTTASLARSPSPSCVIETRPESNTQWRSTSDDQIRIWSAARSTAGGSSRWRICDCVEIGVNISRQQSQKRLAGRMPKNIRVLFSFKLVTGRPWPRRKIASYSGLEITPLGDQKRPWRGFIRESKPVSFPRASGKNQASLHPVWLCRIFSDSKSLNTSLEHFMPGRA